MSKARCPVPEDVSFSRVSRTFEAIRRFWAVTLGSTPRPRSIISAVTSLIGLRADDFAGEREEKKN
jgi:hypothetical protein